MIDLVASCEVENVGKISVPRDHTFFLRLTCTTCRSEFPNAVGVSSDMNVEGIKGAHHTLLLYRLSMAGDDHDVGEDAHVVTCSSSARAVRVTNSHTGGCGMQGHR